MNLKRAKRLRRFLKDNGFNPTQKELIFPRGLHEKRFPIGLGEDGKLRLAIVHVGSAVHAPDSGRRAYQAMKRSVIKAGMPC